MTQQTRRRKRRSNAPMILTISILAVVLIVLLILALTLSKQEQPQDTQPSQQDTSPVTDPTVTQPTVTEPAPLTGWTEEGGKRYYYLDGVPQTGWLEDAGYRYYLAEDGAAVTGWVTVENREYYFRENGAMARGMVEIDGAKRYFTSAGAPIILVNPWNFIPEDYDPELVELPRELGEDHFVVAGDCYDLLVKMLRACNAAMSEAYQGSSGKIPQAYVISSYRTHEYQSNAYQRKIDRVMAADPSLTREEAEVIAAQVVAYPGTSEHQLGLAVDIIDTQLWALEQEQENLPAQQWLMANSWKYGFILRYPEGKTDSTGIIYEPWHYRYVGMTVAKEIHDTGLTLEQYLEGLK